MVIKTWCFTVYSKIKSPLIQTIEPKINMKSKRGES